MNRRMFAGMLAGAAVCSTGKVTTETLAQSKPPDAARMLEVTRVPGIAAAGIKEAKPYQLFAGVARPGGPTMNFGTRFPAASLSKPVFAWAVQELIPANDERRSFGVLLDLRFIVRGRQKLTAFSGSLSIFRVRITVSWTVCRNGSVSCTIDIQ